MLPCGPRGYYFTRGWQFLNDEEKTKALESIRNSEFSSVSIDEFFDQDSKKEDIIQTGIIVFTDHQQKLIPLKFSPCT